ncbi:MAG: chemotaxis protein CheD [Acidobacteriota bacterium]
MTTGRGLPPIGRRRVEVGPGECAVSSDPADVLVAEAVGSGIAVSLVDPAAGVAGLLHLLLPEASINPVRAAEQPAAFADTGLALLLKAAGARGLSVDRAAVDLTGAAETAVGGAAVFRLGRRNLLAVRSVLAGLGLAIRAEQVGGRECYRVELPVSTGRTAVTIGRAARDARREAS